MEEATDGPRVIILGFDGADSDLTRQWMESGDLPNLKKLADRGSFRPLGTSNPAQSPVSWAVFETASNPGKTNLGDFVRRGFTGSGNPFPKLAGVVSMDDPVPASDMGDYVELGGAEGVFISLGDEKNQTMALVVVGAAVFLLVILLLKVLMKMKTSLSLLIGVLVAGGATFGFTRFFDDFPAAYPMKVSEMRGQTFWDVLGEEGVKVTGLQVPVAFPCEANPNAKILAGLFTPDVAGGLGSWYIFTNDEWSINDESTGAGGTVYKLFADKDGVMRTSLPGPDDFVREYRFKERVESLEKLLDEPGLSGDQREQAEKELDQVNREKRDWWEYDRKKKVEMEITPDYENGVATVTIDGQTQQVEELTWSDYFRVNYDFTRFHRLPGVARVYLEECFIDEDDNPRLRFFVPPVSISPEEQPVHLSISSPREFAAELAENIGLYDTIGWACYTNALKDTEIEDQAFLEGLEHVMGWRTRMFRYAMEQDDWDVLFHVESVTDRAGHLLYRFIDEEHPQYNDENYDGELLRDKEVTAYGRSFPARDGIKETYREMDSVVGEVLEKIDSGALGDNVELMIVSDHGFEPFRYGVSLNVWLNRMGYLKVKGEVDAEAEGPEAVREAVDRMSGSTLSFVDWENTRAYSMGLGKIYINLQGREPKGIVSSEEFEPLKKEIIEKLEAFVDPVDGHKGRNVVLTAYDADEIYEGPHGEGFGDIVLGFNEGYRVSWDGSSGGYDKDAYDSFGVGPNEQKWSGDHCGNDPSLVKGIFFSTFKIADGEYEPNLINVVPTVLEMFEVDIPEEWDGTPIPRS